MKAANYIQPGRIEFRDDATAPKAGQGEVLVNVKACGICGSDLHMYRNDAMRERLVRATPEGYDVPGHEFAGVIAEVGEDVTGWSVGDRVVGITGRGGGFAQLVNVPVNPYQLAHMPDEVGFDEAATTEPLADALQLVRLADIKPGENIVVFGVGLIGLGVIQAIHAKGLKPASIIAIDVNQVRLDKALEVGATASVNSAKGEVAPSVARHVGVEMVEGFSPAHAGIDVVFDCAGYSAHFGKPAPLEIALDVVRPNTSRIICFGAFGDEVPINLHNIIRKQAKIMGSLGYDPAEVIEALDLMKSGKIDRRGLLSHSFPLDQISQAFETQGRSTALKVMVEVPELS